MHNAPAQAIPGHEPRLCGCSCPGPWQPVWRYSETFGGQRGVFRCQCSCHKHDGSQLPVYERKTNIRLAFASAKSFAWLDLATHMAAEWVKASPAQVLADIKEAAHRFERIGYVD